MTGKHVLTMKSGSTLQVPDGFQIKTMDQTDQVIKLEDPDGAINTFFVETQGHDLSQALDKSWNRVIPSFRPQTLQTFEPPAPAIVDELLVVNYVSDKETLIQGIAQRKDNTIWLLLISGPKAKVIKRTAQFNSFYDSLKIPGIVEEDLSQKPLKSVLNSIDEFDQFIVQGMEKLEVPGLSIAIVENGKIVFEKGYGVKKWGERDKVNEQTLMKIGSITKSMTTLLMAKLVEEGKFDWRTKVQTLYSEFRVDDDALSETLEMEQLASGSTGLPRKDFPLALNYKGSDVFQQLASIKPTTKSKETFQYNNQLLTAAGYLVAHTVESSMPMDQAFCRLMSEKVFKPIGMNITTFAPQDNYALPHASNVDGENQTLTLFDDAFTDYCKPAGGVWSSAHDMALYIMTELDGGINPKGKRVFEETNLMYRRIPQAQAGHNRHYGLGWGIAKHKGIKLIAHDGGTNGFGSLLKFCPEKKCGFVVLTNGVSGHALNKAINARLLEVWFEINEKSSEVIEFFLKTSKNRVNEFKKRLSEPDPDWMMPFLGTHENKELGVFQIKQEQGIYTLDIGIYKTRLMLHVGKDNEKTLALIKPPFPGGLLLIPNKDGSFKMMEGQHNYVFKKMK